MWHGFAGVSAAHNGLGAVGDLELVKVAETLLATVFDAESNLWPIVAFGNPLASRSRISRSREVNSGNGSATAGEQQRTAQGLMRS